MPMSARRAGAPVPSMTSPLRMARSKSISGPIVVDTAPGVFSQRVGSYASVRSHLSQRCYPSGMRHPASTTARKVRPALCGAGPVRSAAMTPSRRDVTASASRSADALLAGPHGGNGEAVARALAVDPATLLDLSASLNPLAPDVATLLAELPAGCVANYPDPADATDLFAAVLEVDADRLLLTNGGAEAIALLAAAHPTGFVDEPAFS